VEGVELIPSAKRLITSLRDMGYDFSQAVADIVDNSIEAKATVVAIDVEFDGDESWVRIADNGKGMTAEELREAMRYGADREYESDDLGKFGLGLKTASMSQCQRLSVASRWNPDRSDIAAYAWDLDHIERTNRWEILPLDRSPLTHSVRDPLKDAPGTVVLWERLDRVLGFKHPYGEAARKRLSGTCREIELHLGMVFHRFLSGEVRRRRFKLLLNGNEIRPWDPFCRTEKTKALQQVRITVEHEGETGEILLEPFVLPHQDDFSSAEAFRLASGPGSWNQQQGFYIYRAGRMIQSGGWSNLRAPDEHTKLARIAVSFSPSLDAAFKINVAKMRVQLPSQVRDHIREAIGPVVKLAREAYDRRGPKTFVTGSTLPKPAPESLDNSVPLARPLAANKKSPLGAIQLELFTFEDWAQRVLAAARSDELPSIHSVLGRMRIANG
jgi:hypothetical protein